MVADVLAEGLSVEASVGRLAADPAVRSRTGVAVRGVMSSWA